MIEKTIMAFLTFLKIGAFSFGGGYAMLPFIETEVVKNNAWITGQEFLDIIGISQMTPGPVAINTATFAGYKFAGVIGSIGATLGVITISFILVIITSRALKKYSNNPKLNAVLKGMKPGIVALILSAFLSLAQEAYVDVKSLIIAGIVSAMLFSKKVNPILVIVLAAIMGIVMY